LVKAVDGISFTVDPGQTLGVVGESGSGKSVTFLAVMGLLDRKYAQISGEVLFRGEDLLTVSAEELRATRGDRMSMIFQDPLTALNPVHRVGAQIAEVFLAHDRLSKKDAWAAAVTLLERVGISQPSERAKQYPHEFSGGMRQRAMIAMALALNPDLLIADEPTTALDVTVQAQILDLLDRLKDEFNASVVIITHDLGVVAEHCDDIMVMYGGRAVEKGNRDDIYYESQHPYTWGLLGSIARLDAVEARLRPIDGQPPSLINIPQGCAFHPRCPQVMDICRTEVPELIPSDGYHESACHLSLGEKQRIFSEQVAQRA
jgi:peptide/nickel transport system ATP-binding protein